MTAVPDSLTVLPDGSTAPVVAIAGTVALSSAVSVNNFPATQDVSGTVAISNLVSSSTVSLAGPLTIANFPTTQLVGGTVGVVLPPLVAGSASIGNVGLIGTPPVTQSPWQGALSGYTQVNVGTVSSEVFAAGARHYLDLSNPSASVTIFINFGANATIANSPVVLSYGTPRGEVRTWEGTACPTDAIYAVSSAPTVMWIGTF